MKQERVKPLSLCRPSAIKGKKIMPQRMMNVTFGSVTIETVSPSHAEVKRNIRVGQEALARGIKAFLKPGVHISMKKNVPLFSVDPERPTVFIRKLNGKTERGTLNRETGEFEVGS